MRHYFFIVLLFTSIFPIKLNAQYKVMFSNDYPPYNFVDKSGKLVGFNIDLLDAINKLYETKISIDGDQWEVINKALDRGEIQAIGGAHYPGGSDDKYIYTRSTISTSHCFLYNQNYVSKFSLEYLRTIKQPLVALWQNDVLIHYVLSINPSAQFVFVKNYDQLINALDKEDVTCAFGQRVGSMYAANELGKDYIQPLEHRILERNMGFKVSADSPELVKLLNNGLEVILANGEYQQIYNKWITNYNESRNNIWDAYLKYILIIGGFLGTIFLLLIVANRILKARVLKKTIDLRQQLELNSQIMKELEEQKIRAEESDKMKSAFLANMSHEIRTPMNGILGFAELLESADYSSAEQSKFIGIIQKSGNRMLETINNIIDVSKLESGQEKMQIKEVNITDMMNELLNFFSSEAKDKGLKLTLIDNHSTYNDPFYTDEYKLNSILTNLIKNALKFTPEGSVEIKYAIHEKMVEFWITDTGIGIAKDQQSSIFEQFVRADFSHSSKFEGSGLGLSISNAYVKLLNGRIHLESEPDMGSTFYVRIPNNLKELNITNEAEQPTDSKQTKPSKYKIIVAEDDETSFYYLEQILIEVTDRIIHAKNGEEAIEMTKKYADTDIILMDIKMPKINGFEATEEIRKFNKDVYIIAQTAYSQVSDKVKVIEAGCNEFISKPINKKKLLELISNVINN